VKALNRHSAEAPAVPRRKRAKVIEPPHHATVTASATISATINRKTAASKSDVCHMAGLSVSSGGPSRPLYSMGLHRSLIDLCQSHLASSRSNDFASERGR
jgi:hypothetical protein